MSKLVDLTSSRWLWDSIYLIYSNFTCIINLGNFDRLYLLNVHIIIIIIIIIIILIYVGVRASLRAPRLIPRPTEHPANSVGM